MSTKNKGGRPRTGKVTVNIRLPESLLAEADAEGARISKVAKYHRSWGIESLMRKGLKWNEQKQ